MACDLIENRKIAAKSGKSYGEAMPLAKSRFRDIVFDISIYKA
jgi:hypothetical protein